MFFFFVVFVLYGIDAVPSLSMKEKTQKEKREGKKLNFITNNKW